MGLFDKIKKGMELKQPTTSSVHTKKIHERISRLEKKLQSAPDDVQIIIQLYQNYVDLSDTVKKIECMERLSEIRPSDSYPLQQLADIYSNDLDDPKKAKFFQDKANKINKFL